MIVSTMPSLANVTSSQSIPYSNEDLPGVTNVKQALDNLVENKQQMYFSTYTEFPNIGEEDVLYVDKKNRVTYIWDSTKHIYKSIALESDACVFQSIL